LKHEIPSICLDICAEERSLLRKNQFIFYYSIAILSIKFEKNWKIINFNPAAHDIEMICGFWAGEDFEKLVFTIFASFFQDNLEHNLPFFQKKWWNLAFLKMKRYPKQLYWNWEIILSSYDLKWLIASDSWKIL